MSKSYITKRSLDTPKAPEIRGEMPKLAHASIDDLEVARAKILEQKYEIEELKAALSGSYVERLKAELSASYATNREFGRQLQEEKEKNGKLNAQVKNERQEYATNRELGRQLEEEREKNEKLNAELKYEREENEKLCAGLKNERQENEKLNAELNIATLKNVELIELCRSKREQADQLGQILEAIAAWVEKGACSPRLPELIDGDDDLMELAIDDRAA